jgi:hypothetical protein
LMDRHQVTLDWLPIDPDRPDPLAYMFRILDLDLVDGPSESTD